jgi:hypothetical protein
MGNIDIVPIFGSGFTLFFPLVLIIFCLLILFNIHGKLLNFIGLKQFQFTESFADDRIEEGKKLLREGKYLDLFILF